MDIKSTDATDLDLALLMRLVPSGELLVHGKDMSPLSILPDETGRVQGKGSRSFLGDPLSHLVQGSLPPLPGEQLGHLAELHDRLLGEAAMLGLGAVTQCFVDVFRHISNLERTHCSADLLVAHHTACVLVMFRQRQTEKWICRGDRGSKMNEWFVSQFREASEKLRGGNRLARFPVGSFPPAPQPFVVRAG